MIRAAKLEDAARMLEIYSPYITKSAISFEAEPPTLQEFRERVQEVSAKYPWIVFEENGFIQGYAYASTYRTRAAYNWSLESTVYVDENFHGRGIGRKLYEHLLVLLKEQGVVNVIGGIALPNDGSVALHEKMGFKPAGVIKDAGFKFGRWWDVGFWQLQFEVPKNPAPLAKPKT